MDGQCITNTVMKRDAMLNIRLPADMKAALRKAGDDDHGRSISGMVIRILDEWLTKHDYLKKKQPRR
jgi:hypothetical protein